MSRVFEVDPDHTSVDLLAIREAAAAIRGGELVVLPTETVYGIAARPDLPQATGRLFDAKHRPVDLSLPVLADSTQAAWDIGRATTGARRLANRFWPGPLTMVLPRTERSAAWYLGTEERTIAVRVPDHPVAVALCRLAGPLAATSANPSGEPPLADRGSLIKTFGEAVSVYLVARRASLLAGRASTVVDVSGGVPLVIREGPIGVRDIEEAIGSF